MSKLAEAVRSLVRGPVAVGDALAARRNSALQTWKDLVFAAADGKQVDIEKLEQAAVSLRIEDVPAEFDADVDAAKARAEAVATRDRELGVQAEKVKAFEVAQSRLWDLRQQLHDVEKVIAAMPYAGIAVGLADRSIREAEDRAPRLFAREVLERKRTPTDPPVADDEVEQHALGTKPRRREETTFWDTSPD